MSVQVHCDNCDLALEQLAPTREQLQDDAEVVTILIELPNPGFTNVASVVNPDQRVFCDWTCVSAWASGKADGTHL